jgi:hypothetical protein
MSRIRANQITNETSNGAPDFPSGITHTGILTATALANPSADLTITGNLSLGGVLTYEDSANEDSIGIVTARSGIKIGPTAGVAGTFFTDGSYNTAGIITASNVSVANSVTAATLFGDVSNLTNAGIDVGPNEQTSGQTDGSTRSLSFGTYTLPSQTGGYTDVDASYSTITASQAVYKPPTGSIGVMYEFHYQNSWNNHSHGIHHFRLYIDGSANGLSGPTEVVYGRYTSNGYNAEYQTIYKWYFRIRNDGGSFDTNTGAMPAWTENKTISLQHRSYNNASHTMGRFFGTHYWDGAGGAQFSQPNVKITAFK